MEKNNEQLLDDRKVKILDAIIRNYLETGEPVGSRTISKYTDLNLSSATIRNEMADLEELGYIVQPHTSAGRIPWCKPYHSPRPPLTTLPMFHRWITVCSASAFSWSLLYST